VNWAHLETFVWVRWRLAVNQMRRSGAGGVVVSAIFTVLMVAGGVLTLLVGFLVGFLALRSGSPRAVMVVWDAAIAGFVFFWMVGLMSELQRSDALSLDRFLHLPVSPTGAFLINYLGSSVSLGLVLMLPAMTGLSAGLVLSRGRGMLLLFPLVAAFFLMMTAVTYQFRGWLASMMENPRRRRAILTAVPVLFVLAFQIPNLWNNLSPGARERRDARAQARRAIATLDDDLAAGRITREEYNERRPVTPARSSDDAYETTRLVNMIAPPGWLAYGAEAAAEGRAWPALAGVLGMGLIGAVSLRRAYGTTLRLYTGDFDTRRRPAPPAITVASSGAAGPPRHSTAFVEARLPWTSERASGVAVTGLCLIHK
jgi:ABC-2 type transport system permease protein